MDISYCGDKTGFPRPGHIYGKIFKGEILCLYDKNSFIQKNLQPLSIMIRDHLWENQLSPRIN